MEDRSVTQAVKNLLMRSRLAQFTVAIAVIYTIGAIDHLLSSDGPPPAAPAAVITLPEPSARPDPAPAVILPPAPIKPKYALDGSKIEDPPAAPAPVSPQQKENH